MEKSALFQNSHCAHRLISRSSTRKGEGISSSWPTIMAAACQTASQKAAVNKVHSVFFKGFAPFAWKKRPAFAGPHLYYMKIPEKKPAAQKKAGTVCQPFLHRRGYWIK